MIPTFAQVAAHCRQSFLGDTETSGGGLWTNTFLLQGVTPTPSDPRTAQPSPIGIGPLAAAYEAMVNAMILAEHRDLECTAYFNVPPYTPVVLPAAFGLTNFSAPQEIYERSVQNVFPGTNLASITIVMPDGIQTAGQATIKTLFPHPFITGQWIIAFGFRGLSPDFNSRWNVQCPDTSTIILSGCTSLGAWDTTSGCLTDSNEQWSFSPMPCFDEIREDEVSALASSLDQWAWNGNVIRFRPCTASRQIRIYYKLSSSAPTDPNASTGVEGCLNFLSAYAAALCHKSKGMAPAMTSAFLLACGNPTGEIGNGNAGYIGQILRRDIKDSQMERWVTPRFRPKRSVGPLGRGW
jgi:hypothetical protein